ncbi:MAG TPA: hypothetical protein VHQ20_01715 [Patescibacteria group bacterium]|jgi:hypothetical protein|nr:hypothetical protein [Patescibacteria group bacterium]
MKKLSIITAAMFLFTACVFFPKTSLAQSLSDPNPLARRPRIVDVPPANRYLPLTMDLTHNYPFADLTIDVKWLAQDQHIVNLTMMSLPTKKQGLYFVMFVTEKFTVAFGVTSRPLDFLRVNKFQIISGVKDLSKPYIIRRVGETFIAFDSPDKPKKIFDLYTSWWYDFELPLLQKRPSIFSTFNDDDLYNSLDAKFPTEWWWKEEAQPKPKQDNRSIA